MDGLSNSGGSGARIMLKNSKGDLLKHSLHFGFQASNNESEYEVLIASLGLAKKFRAITILVLSNS